jgi:putative membrane-bound dehydrogenase-like protein
MPEFRHLLLILVAVVVPPMPVVDAQDKQPTIAELAARLPAIPPRDPAASRDQIQMLDGFRVTLVAAEPLVRDPVAVDFDESGRMFVVELPQYNGYAVKDFEDHGSVRMLEDTNADGRYDKSTIYVDNLDYPTAIACWDGGLFIGAAPDLLYVKDTDGDGKVDLRQVVFSGFGKDKAGEAHLNSFRWGFDNRFHISTNLAGGEIQIGPKSDGPAVTVRGRGLVFDPRDLTRFELTSGGGQHGMSMDDWGQKFVCSNSVPAQTLMFDDRYIARNPHVQAPSVAVDIAPQGKFTKLFRISPAEPWRQLRTSLRKTGKFRGSDEGGTPFGFFTGATGITVYRGDAWPERFRGNLFVGDVANNLIYRATLDVKGVGLVARRADKDREFFATRDIWTRPVQLANAPDGTLFVLDIYRGLIEGAAFLPPEFLEFLDPTIGNDRGRIYRIEPDGFQLPKTPRLGQYSTAELVGLLDHRNGWHRDTASRLLYQRQDRAAIAPLRKLAESASLPVGRMTALYSLAGLEALDEATLLGALSDTDPRVRVHAARLAERFAGKSPAIAAMLSELAEDPELRVRYQVAFSLGAFRGTSARLALAKIALQDGADRWVRLAVLSSLHEGAGELFDVVAQDVDFRATPHGRDFLLTLARQIGAVNRQDELAVVLKTMNNLPPAEKPFAEKLVQALVEKQKGASRERLLRAAGGKAGELLDELLRESRDIATDQQQAIEQRVAAVRSLRLAPLADVRTLFGELLDLREPIEVQAAVLASLAEYDSPEVAALVLSSWRSFGPTLRAQAAETLLSRPAWIEALLQQIEAGKVARGDLDPARIGLLKKHPDKRIAARVSQVFRVSGLAKRQEVVDRYQASFFLRGNVRQGKAIFKKVCAACHQLEGVGTAIGADLKGIRNRGLPAVMLNILDPNREVKPQFQSYVIQTEDGRLTTGMIENENANSLTIRRPDGTKTTIARGQIETLQSTGVSFMPEGLEKEIDLQAMADLLQYLDTLP